MSAAPAPVDDRRASSVAVALIAAVVVVLGFGSGFWSELAERTGAGGTAAASGRNLGTVVQALPEEVAVGVRSGATPSHAVATTAPPSHAHVAAPSSSTPAAPTTVTSAAAVPPAATAAVCSTGTVAPFWAHLAAAHLETSPGQQVAEALDVDQYVLTHTVLVRSMLSPIVQALLGGPEEPGPFWRHFSAAHLDTSPGQQVADALALDRYVQTHTVLVEDMVKPLVGTC